MQIKPFIKFIRHKVLNFIYRGRKIRYRHCMFHIIAVKNGKEYVMPVWDLPKKIKVKILGNTGKDNIVKIDLTEDSAPKANWNGMAELNIDINFNGSSNNIVSFGKNCTGNYSIACFEGENSFKACENTEAFGLTCHLINNSISIGSNCLISNNVRIWGDGHTIYDRNTLQALNVPEYPVIISDHVWIGERVTLLKGAQIPKNCVVGIGAIVTKKHSQENSIIAGIPARECRTNISWDHRPPLRYSKEINKQNK